MQTTQIQTYKFSELSKEIQEKLIDKEQESLRENFCSDHNYLEEVLRDYGFIDSDIYYSLGYCQCDGAFFTCKAFCYAKLFDSVFKDNSKAIRRKEAITSYLEEYHNADIIRTNHRYNHENSGHFEVTADYTHKDYKHLDAYIEQFEAGIESLRKEACCELYRMIKEDYEFLTSEEQARENLENNDTDYTISGTDIATI